MGDCPRLGRWIGGCRFRPRYDVVGGDRETEFVQIALGVMQAQTRQLRKTYLGDVCETCGTMRFRRKPPLQRKSP